MKQKKSPVSKSILIKDSVVNTIGIPVFVIDKKFRNLKYNHKAAQVFKEVVDVKSLCSLMDASSVKRFQNSFEHSLETKTEKQLGLLIKNKPWNCKIFPGKSGMTIICEKSKPKLAEKHALPNKRILDAMGDSFILTDSELNIVDVNNAICEATGYSREQLIGMNASKMNPALSVSDLKELHKRAQKGHVLFDTRFINHLGEVAEAEVNMFLLKIDGKKYYGSIGRDITEYKKIQDELESTNRKLTNITNAANDALWEINLATGERWANEVHQKFYGLQKEEEMPGNKEWEKHIHPRDRKEITRSLADAILARQPSWNAEYHFKIGKSHWIYVYDRTLLFYGQNGELERMMGSMVDVTELKKAQDELKSQRNLSESIINALPGIFYLLDKDGNHLRWNTNLETVTGYNSEEIKKMKPHDFFYSKESGKLTEIINEVFQKGWSEMEGTIITKEGEGKPYFLNGWRTVVGNQECLIGTGIDLSEIKKAQESVKRMELKIAEQKIQDQKVVSRAIISAQEKERNHIGKELHDNVNQLLAGTRLYLTMGAKKYPEFSEAIKYPLELLDNSIQEIRALTHRHISPSKEMGLKQLAEGIAGLLKTASINCNLEFSLDVEMPESLRINIYRILQEQANNILKHSGAKNVSFEIRSEGSIIYITTIDDGKGFDINQQREGIGVSNIYNRVESYDGTIQFQTAPGAGCRIDIEIPVPDYMQLKKAPKPTIKIADIQI